ncbi:MAG: hypothetical protein R2769_05365 [Saprospiraceae bacterium]
MKDETIKTTEELHPLVPSGEWEGFYCYHYTPEQHKMDIELNFKESIVSGSGSDDVAPFTWKGNYDLEKFKLEMIKYYPTHQVFYKGDIDENGIWGVWQIVMNFPNISKRHLDMFLQVMGDDLKGGFHIWPKKKAEDSNSEEIEFESKKLKEIFYEELV